jgi:hypothetical protein
LMPSFGEKSVKPGNRGPRFLHRPWRQ